MAETKKRRYLFDEAQVGLTTDHKNHYVRAWKEGRGRNAEIMVQVWYAKDKPEGEPDGDWAMPGMLPLLTAIGQAILNTQSDLKK